MISHRSIQGMFARWLCVALALGAPFATQGMTAKKWDFRVLLDDKEIGYHRVSVSPEADGARVSVEARFDVKFLFVTAFRYAHEADEVWKGSCLAELEARTDNNGSRLAVSAEPAADGLSLRTAEGHKHEIPGCVRSFAYWDPALLQSDRLLNTQTGEYQQVRVLNLGDSPVDINGKPVDARQYRLLVDEAAIDLWYTPDMDWLALESVTKDGYRLSYLPREESTR